MCLTRHLPQRFSREKAGLRTGCGVRSQVIDVLEAQIKRRPAMKKVSTVATKQSRNISRQRLTIGLDLGDRNSWYWRCRQDPREAGTQAEDGSARRAADSECVLDEVGQIQTDRDSWRSACRNGTGRLPR